MRDSQRFFVIINSSKIDIEQERHKFAELSLESNNPAFTTYFQYSTTHQIPHLVPFAGYPAVPPSVVQDIAPNPYCTQNQHHQLYPAPATQHPIHPCCPCGQCPQSIGQSAQLYVSNSPSPHQLALPAGTLIVNRFTEINYFDNPNFVKQSHCDMVRINIITPYHIPKHIYDQSNYYLPPHATFFVSHTRNYGNKKITTTD